MILKADILDILFENRNKEYGAYTLRKEYNARLVKAMGGMLAAVLVFIAINFWSNNPSNHEAALFFPNDHDSVKLTVVEIPPEKLPEIEPPKKTATIQNTPPLIVPDEEEVNPPPPIEELDKGDKAIGTENTDGAPPTTLQSPPEVKEPGVAAAPAPPVEEPSILHVAEYMPEFPGGPEAMKRFLIRSLRFEFDNEEPGTRIEIRCRFVVDKEGKVTGIEIIKSAGKNEFDKEVVRVMNKMPQWKPGSQNGRNVAVYYTLPVVVEVPEQ